MRRNGNNRYQYNYKELSKEMARTFGKNNQHLNPEAVLS
jgi:hypothetical protein